MPQAAQRGGGVGGQEGGGITGQGRWALAAGEPAVTGSRWAKRVRLAPCMRKAWEVMPQHPCLAPQGSCPPRQAGCPLSGAVRNQTTGAQAGCLCSAPFHAVPCVTHSRNQRSGQNLEKSAPFGKRLPPHLSEGAEWRLISKCKDQKQPSLPVIYSANPNPRVSSGINKCY